MSEGRSLRRQGERIPGAARNGRGRPRGRMSLFRRSHETGTPRATDPDRAQRSEAGDTLIEILISLTVLGVTGLALLLAFGTSISGSGEHRNLASFDAALRTASAEITADIQSQSQTLFATCSDAPITNVPLPSGYTALIGSPQYWNGSAFVAPPAQGCPTTPPGVANLNPPQQLTITVKSGNGTTSSTTTVVDDPLASQPTSTCGKPDHLAFLQSPANGPTGSALFPQVIVAVEDSSGNVVACDASQVTLTITPGSGGPGASGATLSNCSPAQYNGETIYSNCTILTPGVGYTLTASDPGDGLVTSTATSPPPGFNITAGAPAQLVFHTSPNNSTGGTPFTQQPVVYIEDSAGNLVVGDTSTVSLAIGVNVGNGTLSGCTQASNVNGVVTFTGCSIDKIGTGYTLTATDAIDNLTLPSAPSSPFNITPGPGTQLAFTTQPVGPTSGSVFGTQPAVTIEDAGGNTALSNTSAVTLAIGANPGGGTLSGCSETTVASVANFSGCSISQPGNGYTLVATDGTLTSATSQPFNLVPSTLSKFTLAPSTSTPTAGTPFTVQIIAVDQFNNTVSSYNGAQTIIFTGPANSPSNSSPTYPATVTFTNGVSNPLPSITLVDAQTTPLIATQGSITGQTSLTVGAGAVKSYSIPTTPAAQVAGTAFTMAIDAVDAYGNGVTGSENVNFSGPSNSPNATAPTYPATVTFTNGVSNPLPSIKLVDAQTTTLTVAGPNGSGISAGVTPGSFTVSAGAATIVATSGSGQSAAPGTAFTLPLVATVADQYGNDISGASVTFAGPASGASETFAPTCTSNPHPYSCVATTGANGQATSSAFTANGTAGGYNISASVGAATVNFSETNATASITYVTSKSGTTNPQATPSFPTTAGTTYLVVVFVDTTASVTPTITGTPTLTPVSSNTFGAGSNCTTAGVFCSELVDSFTGTGANVTVTVSANSHRYTAVDVLALGNGNVLVPGATNTASGSGGTKTATANLLTAATVGDISLQIIATDDTMHPPLTWAPPTNLLRTTPNTDTLGGLGVYDAPDVQNESTSVAGFSANYDWGTIAVEIAP